MSAPRKAWCPSCDSVQYVDYGWRCLWCETLTMVPTRAVPREARFASLRTIREAHRLHAEGAPIMEAARVTIRQTRYDDVHGWAQTLRSNWASLGLPQRSRSVAQILRARTEPPGARPGGRPNYRHDIRTAELAESYAATLSTVATARVFDCSPHLVWARLKPLGVIVPQGDRKRATIDRAAQRT